METERTVSQNIWKLYCIKGFRFSHFVTPVIFMQFFLANGLSMADVMLLQSAFSIGIMILDAPAGYIADRVSRRSCMIVGCTLSGIGFGLYSFSASFVGFLISEFIVGAASSFISGTDTAMTYETVLQTGKGNPITTEGRREAIGNFSEGVASVLGGLLATVSVRAPFYAEALIMFLAVPFAFSLVEPKRARFESKSGNIRGFIEIIRYILRAPGLKWLVLCGGIITGSTFNIVWFFEPYMRSVALPAVFFGFVWAAFKVFVGIFSACARGFEKKLGRSWAVLVLLFVSVSGYILLSLIHEQWGIVFFILVGCARGMGIPLLRNVVNENSPGDRRATIVSVLNLTGRLVLAVAGPIIGFLYGAFSLSHALLYAGLFFLLIGAWSFSHVFRSKILVHGNHA